ncbi:hypothetical protein [Methanoculleus sediminis]|uniref:hypothetical protein n=1 Tax=Methanoculleus sediminis TaxID=1550566 RepID=UPI0012E04576|nr:hypothetical protein [Methanoculleus sediminis]
MIASFQRGRGFQEEFCTIETGEGGCSPSHLSVLKLASLALRTLRVLELRSYRNIALPVGPTPDGDVPTVHCMGTC